MHGSFETVARRLKLRVLLAGSGAFQADGGQNGVVYSFILPGDGCSLRLDVNGAEMVSAAGIVSPLDSGWDDTAVSALMHQVDCSIWGEAHRLAGTIPTTVRDLADLMATSNDPCIGRAVDRAWARGAAIDLGTGTAGFKLNAVAQELAEAAMWSEDVDLFLAAEETLAASTGLPAPMGFCPYESEAWSARMAGIEVGASPSP